MEFCDPQVENIMKKYCNVCLEDEQQSSENSFCQLITSEQTQDQIQNYFLQLKIQILHLLKDYQQQLLNNEENYSTLKRKLSDEALKIETQYKNYLSEKKVDNLTCYTKSLIKIIEDFVAKFKLPQQEEQFKNDLSQSIAHMSMVKKEEVEQRIKNKLQRMRIRLIKYETQNKSKDTNSLIYNLKTIEDSNDPSQINQQIQIIKADSLKLKNPKLLKQLKKSIQYCQKKQKLIQQQKRHSKQGSLGNQVLQEKINKEKINEDEMPNKKTDQTDFLHLCLKMKGKLEKNHPGKKLLIYQLFQQTQRQNIEREQWEEWIWDKLNQA